MSTVGQSAPVFDPNVPLPDGTVLLEASAGTGKTETIARLAAAMIGEGRAEVHELLLMTFGRAATRELRERVHSVLLRARDEATDDLHRVRLERAIADFDALTVVTTHQFCRRTLAGLGIAADTDPDETMVEDLTDVVHEVTTDFYVRKYARNADSDVLGFADAGEIVSRTVKNPLAEVVPATAQDSSVDQVRASLAHRGRDEVRRRREAHREVTYDDLVSRTADALRSGVTAEMAIGLLSQRYRVVMVDEFQDTDLDQWVILRTAFHREEPEPGRSLLLIGDPKQAIYAFRGGDVVTYLAAEAEAHAKFTLAVNYRSDARLVEGVAELLGATALGDPKIAVLPVSAHRQGSRLRMPGEARVRLRCIPDGDVRGAKAQRAVVAVDVATDVAQLLNAGVELEVDGGTRTVAPGDIAVIVPTNAQAAQIHDALADARVPSVISGSGSVFDTLAARNWRDLLTAIDKPWSRSLRTAALTDFFGHTMDQLADPEQGDRITAEVLLALRRWAVVLAERSVAALAAIIAEETGLGARVLGQVDGERHLTDLRHLAEMLHAQQRRTNCGTGALLDWLTERMAEAAVQRSGGDEISRRLESDAAAVQIVTVHRSKGQQYPICYLPFMWDRYVRAQKLLEAHDAQGHRVIDVRLGGEGRSTLARQAAREAAGESLRTLYVALTRASSAVVLHWAPTKMSTGPSPIHRLLSAREAGERDPAPSYSATAAPVGWLAESPLVRVEQVDAATGVVWAAPRPTRPPLGTAPIRRSVDVDYTRTSYSGLTRFAHEASWSAARDSDAASSLQRGDEPLASEPDEYPPALDAPAPELYADLPAGAAFGTLVHGVLEVTDHAAADLQAEILRGCQEQLSGYPLPDVDETALATALVAALRTPLGPLVDDLSLSQIPVVDRLAELDFEFPMSLTSAGVDAERRPRLGEVVAVLRERLDAADPMIDYADHLAEAGIEGAVLHGYLIGSIDAVLRIDGRYLVVDYKTNKLGTGLDLLSESTTAASRYGQDSMRRAMFASHYPLQALIYSVALHRFLRWKLPDYDPERHLGGVLYLFLRGMVGPDTACESTERGPVPQGVFTWKPPAALVLALSDLFDGLR